jgi:heme exporter protein CcmD
MDLGAPHAAFVIAAYTLAIAVIALLCGFVISRDRRLKRKLAERTIDD